MWTDGRESKGNQNQFCTGEGASPSLQLRMDAGIPLREGDSKMFMGSTVQINNVLDFLGNATGNSTLGGSVTEIFNREFFYDSNYPFELYKQRGVPVTRMDLRWLWCQYV